MGSYVERDPSAPSKLLEAVYVQERNGLIRYLRRFAGCDAAPDLAQEVFLRAVASAQVPHLVNPAAFLYRIARNMLIDRSRRMRVHGEPLPLIDALDMPCQPEQEHGIAARDLQEAYDRALASLPTKTRQIFVMNRFGGLPYRVIHCELGISVSTVEYHMGKALAHLRQAIADVG